MKIDLLRFGQMKHATGIPELARIRTLRIVADIFGEQAETFGQLFFQNESRLRDASGRKIVRTKKLGEHAADAPSLVQLPGPGQLHIRLGATARDGYRTRRQRDARDDR